MWGNVLVFNIIKAFETDVRRIKSKVVFTVFPFYKICYHQHVLFPVKNISSYNLLLKLITQLARV